MMPFHHHSQMMPFRRHAASTRINHFFFVLYIYVDAYVPSPSRHKLYRRFRFDLVKGLQEYIQECIGRHSHNHLDDFFFLRRTT